MQYSATMGAPGIGGFNMGIGTGANPPAATFGDVACTTDYVTIPGLHEGGDKANGHGIIACREPDQLKTVKKLLQKL